MKTIIEDIIPPNAILLICRISCAKVGFKLKYNPELVKTNAAAKEAEINDHIAGGKDGLFK